MELRGATASHVGNVRETNQDRTHFGGFVAVVADGMGGHQGGETAASIAISQFLDVGDPIAPGGLVELVEHANRAVFERAAEPELRGMGTTLVAMTLRPNEGNVIVVNVGDSRAYWLRGNEMGQLTLDHSLVEDLVRQNRLSKEEALTHPQRNILTRALGIAPDVEVDRFLVSTEVGDRFLLCSDGLFNEVTEDEILRIMQDNPEPNHAADALVAAALRGAGRDNVTVAVVDVVADGHAAHVSSSEPETLQMPSYDPEAGGEASGTPPAAGAPAGAEGGFGMGHSAAGQTMTAAPAATGTATATAEAPTGQITVTDTPGAVGLAEEATSPILNPDADATPVEAQPVTAPEETQRRNRLATFLFTVGFLALLVTGLYYAADYWGRLVWHVDIGESGEVLLINGRPDGVWILAGDTEGEQIGTIDEGQLSDGARAVIAEGRTFDSKQDAEDFITENLNDDVLDQAEPAEPTAPPEDGTEPARGAGGDAGSGEVVEDDTLNDLSDAATEGDEPQPDAGG
ncbi:MAG: protein phosphatase 2C domain-containing protein [Actinomycetota bacterium]